MAITPAQLQWTDSTGRPLASGRLHDIFARGTVGAATEYRAVELRNLNTTLTLASPKLWCVLDPAGVQFAVALVQPAALAAGADWPAGVDLPALSYSSPTSFASGLALPSLGPGERALLGFRRVLTGAAVTAETNRVTVRGTSPI